MGDMQLYTKEQVIQIVEKSRATGLSAEYLLLTSQLPQQEISDEEIFKQSIKAMEERYGSGCDEEIDAHFRGAIWYREQLKKKQ